MLVDVFTYLTMFFISTFFFYIVELQYKLSGEKRSRIQVIAASIIAVIIPCLFAAFRADTVGADTCGYPVEHMKIARACGSIKELFGVIDFEAEYSYGLLVYLSSRITSNSAILLFWFQMLTIVPIYRAALKMKDKVSVACCMLVYFLMFYNNSFNMMRQSVACAFVLYGIIRIITEKKISIRTCFILLFAITFHKSGIISLIGIILVLGINKINRLVVKIALFVTLCFLPLIINIVFNFLLYKGVLPIKYIAYGDIFLLNKYHTDWLINPFNIYSMTFVFILITVLMISLFARKYSINRNECVFSKLNTINICGLLIYLSILFGLKTMYGIRFSTSYDFFYIISLPGVLPGKNNKFKTAVLISLLTVFWFIWIFINGWSASANYRLRF